MKKLLPLYNKVAPVREGEIVKGKVLGKEKMALFVDLGPRGVGVIRGEEFLLSKNQIKDLNPGDEVEAKVIYIDQEDGYIGLSLRQIREEEIWEFLQKAKEEKRPIEVKILSANRGGLLTKIEGIQAFIPASQLSSDHYPKVEGGNPERVLEELQKFVGQTLKVCVLTLDPKNNQIILSEKVRELEEKKDIIASLKEGDIVEGEITAVCDFGAFIKFAPPHKTLEEAKKANSILEGLIHISELSEEKIENPNQVVKAGEKRKAKIVQVKGNRVFLSLKNLR